MWINSQNFVIFDTNKVKIHKILWNFDLVFVKIHEILWILTFLWKFTSQTVRIIRRPAWPSYNPYCLAVACPRAPPCLLIILTVWLVNFHQSSHFFYKFSQKLCQNSQKKQNVKFRKNKVKVHKMLLINSQNFVNKFTFFLWMFTKIRSKFTKLCEFWHYFCGNIHLFVNFHKHNVNIQKMLWIFTKLL